MIREEIIITCVECPYFDICDWDQDLKTGKASPIYWCEKLKVICDDKTKCKFAKNKKF